AKEKSPRMPIEEQQQIEIARALHTPDTIKEIPDSSCCHARMLLLPREGMPRGRFGCTCASAFSARQGPSSKVAVERADPGSLLRSPRTGQTERWKAKEV